jgi:pimeloyl-ACP methyl ester carboxylesterase
MKAKMIHLVVTTCLLAGLVSCGRTKVATPSGLPAPTFEKAACPFRLPPGQVDGKTVECGYLTVPENRSGSTSASSPIRTIRLAVAIFHPSDGAAEPDPIIYLMGGPGASALEFLYLSFNVIYAPILAAQRDLIFFDQRGVGLSQPALDCNQAWELSLELLDNEMDGKPVSDGEAKVLFHEAYKTCAQELQVVADLTTYNSVSSAADVNDLRIALGYEQINLWGGSYGTRLALGILRDYPKSVRSVVLDSVYPPDVDLNLGTPANLERALTLLFQACRDDPACNTAYPNLRQVFFATAAQLEAAPVASRITDPFTGETHPILMDGDALFGLIFQLLYDTEALPVVPQLIYEANQGNFGTINRIFGALIGQSKISSRGAFFSVQCNEELAFSSWEKLQAVLVDYPDTAPYLQKGILGEAGYDVCAFWGASQASPNENKPVSSDIPALVMQGEHDPITPPAWGQQAAETLKNSYFFLFPDVGHGVMGTACGREMTAAFFQNPLKAPQNDCIAKMGGIDFSVPVITTHTIEMVTFTNSEKGIQGVAPQGWKEAAQGTYTRGNSSLDETALIIDTAAASARELLKHLEVNIGFDPDIESLKRQVLGNFTWDFYSFEYQGLVLDLALAEDSGMAYMVLLVSEPDEQPSLYEHVFIPAVKALTPNK